MKRLLMAVGVVGMFAVPALAGEITGEIRYGDKSPCSGCKVSASINSGGVTDAVYTDSNGKFSLRWSGSNWIAKLFVNGSTVAQDVKPGEHVQLTVR